MELEKINHIIFNNVIASLSDYAKAVEEDPSNLEVLEYCEGIVCGQLKVALDLKVITTEDVRNIYTALIDYRTNKILPKLLMV